MQRKDFLDAIKWRYATKKFDATKKVSDEDFGVLIESLHLSPSSYGLQQWKFIVVQNPEMRKKMQAVSWNQSQVVDSSHYVVFAALNNITEEYIVRHVNHTAKVRGMDPAMLAGYKDLMVGNLVGKKDVEWSARQAYIALGNLMNAAALLRIDTCPMEGLDPAEYDKILGLVGTDYSAVCACAIGYRSADDEYAAKKKVRFDLSEVVEYRV